MSSVIGDARTVRLSRAAFSLESVKRASYSLMARYDVSVALSGDEILCTLMPASSAVQMETAERDFRREVVDQDLRISIEQRTETYRDTILGLAFSRTGLQGG
jgi:His-Xaa-Ser system protein HxsD